MPSLVNGLSSQQRMWLFETFGPDNGENHELQQAPATHYLPDERRFSDASQVHVDPYQPPRDQYGNLENRNSIFRRGGHLSPHSQHHQHPHEKIHAPRHWNEPHPYEMGSYSVRPPFHPRPPPHSDDSNMNVVDSKIPLYPHQGEKLTWQQSFENLNVYKETYGDCNVPQKYKHNVKLGGWVNKQRKKKKNPIKYGKLTEAQIESMERLGFMWNVEHGV